MVFSDLKRLYSLLSLLLYNVLLINLCVISLLICSESVNEAFRTENKILLCYALFVVTGTICFNRSIRVAIVKML